MEQLAAVARAGTTRARRLLHLPVRERERELPLRQPEPSLIITQGRHLWTLGSSALRAPTHKPGTPSANSSSLLDHDQQPKSPVAGNLHTDDPASQTTSSTPSDPATIIPQTGRIRAVAEDCEPQEPACVARSATTSASRTSIASLSRESTTSAPSTTTAGAASISRVTTSQSHVVYRIENVYEISPGLFIAPELEMGQHDRDTLRKIWDRLDNVIENTLLPNGDDEAAFSYEFMMAGPSKTRFKPSVIVVCSNERQKKALKAVLNKQSWIREYPYFWQVIVNPIDKLCKACMSRDTSGPMSTKAFVSKGTTELTGSPATSGEAIFTIGGTIFIDGKLYGLTAGHPFQGLTPRLLKNISKTSSTEDESEDSPYADSESGSIFNFSDDDEVRNVESNNTVLSKPTPPPLASFKTVSWDMESPIGMVQYPVDDQRRLDWAVIKLCESISWPLNQLSVPGQVGSTLINSILEPSRLFCGQVWVKGGYSSLVRGTVHEWPALLHLDGMKLETWQILLEQPMGKQHHCTTSNIANLVYQVKETPGRGLSRTENCAAILSRVKGPSRGCICCE